MSMTPPRFMFVHELSEFFAFSLPILQSHSEVPQKDEDWPSVGSILEYQSRVRERILKIYEDIESGKRTLTRKIARVLFLALEHDAMHAEVGRCDSRCFVLTILTIASRRSFTCFFSGLEQVPYHRADSFRLCGKFS